MNTADVRSDEELAVEVRLGNRDLYEVLIGRYQHKLLRYATTLVHNEQRAVDVVQDSFIKAFINLNGFNAKKKFSSWIYRIVHNEALNVLKRSQREVSLPSGVDFESTEDIEREFEKGEYANLLDRCLGKIPLIYSEPLSLHYREGRSYEEISDILRLPMGTVATRMRRAKIILKHICQKN